MLDQPIFSAPIELCSTWIMKQQHFVQDDVFLFDLQPLQQFVAALDQNRVHLLRVLVVVVVLFDVRAVGVIQPIYIWRFGVGLEF